MPRTTDRKSPTTTHWGDESHEGWITSSKIYYYDPGFSDACIQRLDQLRKLNAGWDNEDAPPIDRHIADAVQHFIDSLPSNIAVRPMVVPLSSGGVQLEWHFGQLVLELEWETPDTVHYLKWDPEKGVEEEQLVPAFETGPLVELIEWFMKGMLGE